MVDLATLHSLASLNPEEAAASDRQHLLRRLARRYRPEIIAGSAGEGVFSGDRLLAFALRSDAVNPLSRDRERHLIDLVASGDQGMAALPELLGAETTLARRQRIDVMRCELDCMSPSAGAVQTSLLRAGYVQHHLVLRKSLCEEERPACDIAATPPAHQAFALDCLRRSIARGLLAAGVEVERERLDLYLRRRYKLLNTRTRRSFVAFGPDLRPRAHCLVELVAGRLCRSPEAIVVDVHVPADSVGQGWGTRLSAQVERELLALGVRHAEASLVQVNVGNWGVVLASALGRGWYPVRQSYLLPVRRRLDGVGPLLYHETDW